MRNRQYRLQAAGVAAIIVLALGWASAVWAAPPCAVCKTSILWLPLGGDFFYPPSPALPGETVALDGDVLVVAHVDAVVAGKFQTDIYVATAGVTGVGQTTHNHYFVSGFHKFLDVLYPRGPVFPPGPIRATFSIEPTNRGVSVPLPVTLNLAFGNDGKLLPSSTVAVAACNTDGCS
jgi:hypothetical protein